MIDRLPDQVDALIEMRVRRIRQAARLIKLYDLVPANGSPLPKATPGAHIDVHLPTGLIRQYSIISARDVECYTIGVKRDAASRGGSIYLHDMLQKGDLLKIGVPRNNFPLVASAAPVVLVAGGIGITPMHAMIDQLEDEGADWRLFYSCRNREEAAFLSRFQNDARATLNFDDENNGRYLDLPMIVAAAPADAHFYCCGPLPMLKSFEAATTSLPPERVHVEYFTSGQEAAMDGGFSVVLARSGLELEVPSGQTILQVLRDHDLDVTTSCEQGVCGLCETTVLEGEPDHRDEVLSDSERAVGDRMMICCSGSKGKRLVLDL